VRFRVSLKRPSIEGNFDVEVGYQPVRHVPEEFLAKAQLKPGFSDAYAALELEYVLARQVLKARSQAALMEQAIPDFIIGQIKVK
jgi:hypothetical protein